ncbi:MAG TPA: SPOR domain-containing protein [Candidatus Sulfotelmatobacter sp.]|nr:SPOR domain-containing protein [Candidatus Sulfotelmatobacter sp.]
MASSEDTEITLGTGKLLVLFFGLVAICALFFALGYSLGRKSEPTIAAASTPASPPVSANTAKATSGSAAPPMTFYKAVEQKEANPELTPPSDTKTDSTTAPSTATAPATPAQAPQSTAVDPNTTLPATGYYVQIAAVTKQEDAQALVDALKKKNYPAFVAAQSTSDKLFHVQVGPFAEVKDAEAMRTQLIGDGYNPMLKK